MQQNCRLEPIAFCKLQGRSEDDRSLHRESAGEVSKKGKTKTFDGKLGPKCWDTQKCDCICHFEETDLSWRRICSNMWINLFSLRQNRLRLFFISITLNLNKKGIFLRCYQTRTYPRHFLQQSWKWNLDENGSIWKYLEGLIVHWTTIIIMVGICSYPILIFHSHRISHPIFPYQETKGLMSIRWLCISFISSIAKALRWFSNKARHVVE